MFIYKIQLTVHSFYFRHLNLTYILAKGKNWAKSFSKHLLSALQTDERLHFVNKSSLYFSSQAPSTSYSNLSSFIFPELNERRPRGNKGGCEFQRTKHSIEFLSQYYLFSLNERDLRQTDKMRRVLLKTKYQSSLVF